MAETTKALESNISTSHVCCMVVPTVYSTVYTSLYKPRGNLLENLFSKKCAFKNNLQLLEKKFLSQTNTTPKNGILLSKMAHFQESSIFQ
jgi:hypothetical protein